MILSAHQPNYLPYLGFFHKLAQSDIFIILDDVQFVKSGELAWQHRNRIRTATGWQWLTVPVLHKGKFGQNINEVAINNNLDWRQHHLKSISQNYGHAPYYHAYIGELAQIYTQPWEKLIDLNLALIDFFLRALKISVPVKRSSEYGLVEAKDERLIKLCQLSQADTYLSGQHGRDYLEPDKWQAAKIEVVYQDFSHPEYRQQYADFIPNLCVLDLLFAAGDNSLGVILGR